MRMGHLDNLENWVLIEMHIKELPMPELISIKLVEFPVVPFFKWNWHGSHKGSPCGEGLLVDNRK